MRGAVGKYCAGAHGGSQTLVYLPAYNQLYPSRSISKGEASPSMELPHVLPPTCVCVCCACAQPPNWT